MGYDGGEFLRALKAAPLHWKTRAVGFAMATHGIEGTGRCVISHETLAAATGLTVWSVDRGLQELAEAGFLGAEPDADDTRAL